MEFYALAVILCSVLVSSAPTSLRGFKAGGGTCCHWSSATDWCSHCDSPAAEGSYCDLSEEHCANCAGSTWCPRSGPSPNPTSAPTTAPTAAPTRVPTSAPTPAPTPAPTSAPTAGRCCFWSQTDDRCGACELWAESDNFCAGSRHACEVNCGHVWCPGGPTPAPTTAPTSAPTPVPTSGPTPPATPSPPTPTAAPTSAPTLAPTAAPTSTPTSAPTVNPTSAPTAVPTPAPTSAPTAGRCCFWPQTDGRCGACESWAEPDNFCAGSQHACEVNCGHVWCPGGPTPAPTTAPTSVPTPVPTSGPTPPATPSPPTPPTPSIPTATCPYEATSLPASFDEGCLEFAKDTSNSCGAGLCGQCANPGSKYTLKDHTQVVLGFSHDTHLLWTGSGFEQGGYFVSTDLPSSGGDPTEYAYMCMDWTFGSSRMTAAEEAYNAESGDSVYFGVGTDGCTQISNMGGCYRITYGSPGAGSAAEPKDMIVQAVNSGSDVHCPQFDLQVGVGGQGVHNNCIGGTAAMFDGDQSGMGERYGGWKNRADCGSSPQFLKNSTYMNAQSDDLVQMCELSFDRNVRGDDGLNSRIIEMSQVTCPSQLTALTGMRRADQDSFGFQHNTAGVHVSNPTSDCGFNTGGDGSNCLSRMMDCRKPSASFKDNVDLENMCYGMKILPACTNDGYTRITSDCGMNNCWA